jgi:hypothetical protein
VARPGTVEAEFLAQLDDPQGGLVSRARIVAVEPADGEKTKLARGPGM